MDKPQAAIIGAGELGSAVASMLRRNGIAPRMWDADPARVPGQKTLKNSLDGAACVLFCVPSWAVRDAIAAARETGALRPETVLIAFSKGLEAERGMTMAEFFPSLFGAAQPVVVIGGPMLAEEIEVGKGAVMALASKHRAALDMARVLFEPEPSAIRVECDDDMFSLSVAGVLKNIYAIALGVADGLGYSDNEKGWLAAWAIREMLELAAALGADREAVLGSGGVGDLLATGYSAYSRNRGIGAEIARTGVCSLRGEGVVSLPLLRKRLAAAVVAATPGGAASAKSFPLLDLISVVAIECKPARPAFDMFFHNRV